MSSTFRVIKAYGESKFSPDKYDNRVFDHKIIVDGQEYYASTKNKPMEEGVEYEAELGDLYGTKKNKYYPKEIRRTGGGHSAPQSRSRPSSAPQTSSQGDIPPSALIVAVCEVANSVKGELWDGVDPATLNTIMIFLGQRGVIEAWAKANMDNKRAAQQHNAPPVEDIPPDDGVPPSDDVPF